MEELEKLIVVLELFDVCGSVVQSCYTIIAIMNPNIGYFEAYRSNGIKYRKYIATLGPTERLLAERPK